MKSRTETIRRIWNCDNHFLEVFPEPDGPGRLTLATAGDDNAKYFGAVDLPMSPDFAEQLGRALIAAAEEARGAK